MFKTLRVVMPSAAVALSLGLAPGATATAATILSGSMTADNAFFAFISTDPSTSGTLIGAGNSWPSSYDLTPTALTPGVTNYLNVEAINYGGPGGFSAVLQLSGPGFVFGNGGSTLTTDPTNLAYWSGSYNSSSSDVSVQPWVPATGPVLQETSYYWGDVVGTPNWIWPSDSSSSPGGQSGPCGYCTVDFTVAISPAGAVPEPATWTLAFVGSGLLGGALRSRRRAAVAPLG